MTIAAEGSKIPPGRIDAGDAQRALNRIRSFLEDRKYRNQDEVTVHFETGDNTPLVLPREVVEMFAGVLAALAAGQGVQIMPVNAEVTTQQAAEILNVSRPYLIKLLEEDQMPFRLVGRHRRIRFEDVMAYKREDDQRQVQAADEMTQLIQEMGLD